MTAGALFFLVVSWTFVLGLVIWSFWRILTAPKPLDPDGIGPASPTPKRPAKGKR